MSDDRDEARRPGDGAPDERARRPMIERIGLALIALVMALAFGGVAVAAWVGGELFLAVMGAVGCLMTAWVGGLTVLRG
jgi:fatty acid desaturase